MELTQNIISDKAPIDPDWMGNVRASSMQVSHFNIVINRYTVHTQVLFLQTFLRYLYLVFLFSATLYNTSTILYLEATVLNAQQHVFNNFGKWLLCRLYVSSEPKQHTLNIFLNKLKENCI